MKVVQLHWQRNYLSSRSISWSGIQIGRKSKEMPTSNQSEFQAVLGDVEHRSLNNVVSH